MADDYPFFAGELASWPSKSALALMFRAAGYLVDEGRYSVSLNDFEHFVFRELGGDLGPGRISAGSESAEELIAFSRRVSQTLGDAGIKHRFEIYSGTDELIAYMHHDWPADD